MSGEWKLKKTATVEANGQTHTQRRREKKLHPTTRMKNGLKSEFKKHAILTSKNKKDREFHKKRHANISFVFQEIVSE